MTNNINNLSDKLKQINNQKEQLAQTEIDLKLQLAEAYQKMSDDLKSEASLLKQNHQRKGNGAIGTTTKQSKPLPSTKQAVRKNKKQQASAAPCTPKHTTAPETTTPTVKTKEPLPSTQKTANEIENRVASMLPLTSQQTTNAQTTPTAGAEHQPNKQTAAEKTERQPPASSLPFRATTHAPLPVSTRPPVKMPPRFDIKQVLNSSAQQQLQKVMQLFSISEYTLAMYIWGKPDTNRLKRIKNWNGSEGTIAQKATNTLLRIAEVLGGNPKYIEQWQATENSQLGYQKTPYDALINRRLNDVLKAASASAAAQKTNGTSVKPASKPATTAAAKPSAVSIETTDKELIGLYMSDIGMAILEDEANNANLSLADYVEFFIQECQANPPQWHPIKKDSPAYAGMANRRLSFFRDENKTTFQVRIQPRWKKVLEDMSRANGAGLGKFIDVVLRDRQGYLPVSVKAQLEQSTPVALRRVV